MKDNVKRGVGRPRKKDGLMAGRITVNFGEERKELINTVSESVGMTMAGFIQQATMKAVRLELRKQRAA